MSATDAHQSLPDAYDSLSRRSRKLVTCALLACAFLAMLDGTVIGTALPRIVGQLGGTGTWYVWLLTAYLLTSSVSVPVYGRCSDLYGRRRLLLGGLALFLLGSLACGLSGSVQTLIVARAVQGLGAGALLTLGMALIRDLHPPGRSDGLVRMQTVLAAMMILGMVGGPVLGGLLTDHVGWRWAFWINLPLGLAAAAVLARVLPQRGPATGPAGPSGGPPAGPSAGPSGVPSAGPAPAPILVAGRLDVAGIALLTAGLSLTLTGLSLKGNTVDGQRIPWSDPAVAGCLLGGLALLALLVPVERRAAVPVLPLSLFRHRGYGALLIAGFLFQAAALPIGAFVPLYFQYVRGHSATGSGLLLLPLLIGMTLGNRLTASAVVRGGRVKPALLTGAGLLTAGTAAFFALDASTPLVLVCGFLLLTGLGTGPAMGGITIAAQNSVPPADMGTATAGSALTKQIGGAFGLACAQSLTGRYGTVCGAACGAPEAGPAIAWTGTVAGLLALLTLLLMRDIAVPGAGVPVPRRAVPAVCVASVDDRA
ncbi:MFS transporter [Streptomyces sp. MST-110588]|uniref:MFS transporter n=1 Tax=Streptomyces sp. MST-110588 TaxID=2833628 RepID=UPI001F5DF6AF|nr:MFS transporter [Streptomyces sp. MST-110588]UNO40460.1 MFS transporter [Streptomyces sp. MST-110588]